jgi:RING finger and CHY zinc finger domain-containing protein 1
MSSDENSDSDSNNVDDNDDSTPDIFKNHIFSMMLKDYENKMSIRCKHIKKNCRICTPCCNQEFKCSICHDEYFATTSNVHILDRSTITRIICEKCDTTQNMSNKCIKCDIQFANYYCDICRGYSENTNNYHCTKCGKCKHGKRKDYKHCDVCCYCIEKNIFDSHKCIQGVSQQDCCICLSKMTKGSLTIAECNHVFHKDCFTNLCKSHVLCPLCKSNLKKLSVCKS